MIALAAPLLSLVSVNGTVVAPGWRLATGRDEAVVPFALCDEAGR